MIKNYLTILMHFLLIFFVSGCVTSKKYELKTYQLTAASNYEKSLGFRLKERIEVNMFDNFEREQNVDILKREIHIVTIEIMNEKLQNYVRRVIRNSFDFAKKKEELNEAKLDKKQAELLEDTRRKLVKKELSDSRKKYKRVLDLKTSESIREDLIEKITKEFKKAKKSFANKDNYSVLIHTANVNSIYNEIVNSLEVEEKSNL